VAAITTHDVLPIGTIAVGLAFAFVGELRRYGWVCRYLFVRRGLFLSLRTGIRAWRIS
jgi:hypothetical protein